MAAKSKSLKASVLSLTVLFGMAMVPAQEKPFDLGPKIGETIPSFQLKDQYGHEQNLKSLVGPKGLVLLFFRSADW